MLPPDLVDVAGVGGTPAKLPGKFLVQATVPLAVRVPTALHQADLAVHTRASEPEARASEPEAMTLHMTTAAVATPLVVAICHDAPVRHAVMARGPGASEPQPRANLCAVARESQTAASRRHVPHAAVAAATSVYFLVEVVDAPLLQTLRAFVNELISQRRELRRAQAPPPRAGR